ncbi:hypothetical protein CGCSCA4_v001909 [Colletotrichum siamense]|uniref:Uncharacterized protein n=1 Tax=Colletotrichum siamense TaxID=690259 RepID=A0A9P5K983_COLSI|nr:hypothetical protein CGCSCA4_v001909 [Colletotrichum siamense]KAF4864434.1 hypothetical protein CGCSCA2_v002045 [Colletotrichum siamense]
MYDDEWNRLTPEEQHERRKEHGTWPARFLKALRSKLHKKQSPEQRMGATGELTRRRRIQLHFLELYFSPAIVARIRPNFQHFAEYQLSLSRYVRYRCQDMLPREFWNLPAHSPSRMTKARLLLVISLVFHPDVSAQIAANIEEFDGIAGVECADGFIGETGLRDWLKYLLDYTLSGLAAASRPFLRYDEAAWFDTDDEGIPEKIPGPSPEWIKILSEHRILNIQQVSLKGTNILEAWRTHPATRSLSRLEDGQNELRHDPADLGPTWTPATPGTSCVYTSTNEHFLRETWHRPFLPLNREIEENQMTPRFVDGAITRFSPLREYLWTAFRTHMISLKPPVEELPHLRAPWTARDRKPYRGVLLTQYNSTQPAPAELSHYIVPEGQETAWGDLSLNHWVGDAKAWDHYNQIHGQGHLQQRLARVVITVKVVPAAKQASSSKGESSIKKPPHNDDEDDDYN